MPEFILDTGSSDGAAKYKQCDAFTQGYIEALFFTNSGTGDDAENDMEHATVGELSAEAWSRITGDCATFQEQNAELLAQAYQRESRYYARQPGELYDAGQAGRDFWFNRNRHGVGYWDRGLGEIGDKLSNVCHAWPELWPYRGDDGLLYIA